jgi:hypothetical protein
VHLTEEKCTETQQSEILAANSSPIGSEVFAQKCAVLMSGICPKKFSVLFWRKLTVPHLSQKTSLSENGFVSGISAELAHPWFRAAPNQTITFFVEAALKPFERFAPLVHPFVGGGNLVSADILALCLLEKPIQDALRFILLAADRQAIGLIRDVA